jgi:PAS domain S-box-containing protein
MKDATGDAQSEERTFPPDPTSGSETIRQGLEDYAVITLDTNGTILQWSSGAERIFVYAQSEIIGRPVALLFTPEDQLENGPAQELGLAARQDTAEDQRWHLRKDGTRIWVSGTVRAVRNETGELSGFTKIARDITSQKLQELQRDAKLTQEQTARVEAERRWKHLEEVFENAPVAIIMLRLPEQVYVFANRVARELVQNQLMIGLTLRGAFPEVATELYDILDTVAATGRPYFGTERVVGLRAGNRLHERYFDFRCQPMYSEAGQYDAILVFALDVTDRVRARTALEEQANLLDLAHDAIMSLATDSIIEFWNHGAEEMYGWSKEEALGRNVHELLQTTAPLPLEELRHIVLSNGEWNGEQKHRNRSGQELEVWSRWVARRHNGTSGWLEITRDITERKRLDAHLRDTQKLESLGVLAGGVAHDFNNILTGVIGSLSLALEVAEPASPIRNLLVEALRASERRS